MTDTSANNTFTDSNVTPTNDSYTGGNGNDTFVFNFSVTQTTTAGYDVTNTVNDYDWVNHSINYSLADLGIGDSVTVGGVTYTKPAVTASITAWNNWNTALNAYVQTLESDNPDYANITWDVDSQAFTNSNPAKAGKGAVNTVGTIQLTDGLTENYQSYDLVGSHDVTSHVDGTTVTTLTGGGNDVIVDYTHNMINGTFTGGNPPSGSPGNDVVDFHGLSNDSGVLNYWGNWLSGTTNADGNLEIHFHDVLNNGADVSTITMLGVHITLDALIAQNGAVSFA